MVPISEIEKSSRDKEDFGVDAMKFIETSDGTQWQNIESINDLDKFMPEEPKGMMCLKIIIIQLPTKPTKKI